MKTRQLVLGLIVTFFAGLLLSGGSFTQRTVASIGLYDWPMHAYDSACKGFSPSTAPNTNATAWVTNLAGGTVWAYPVVAEGKVFIGAGGYLNAFDEDTGSLLWQYIDTAQPGYPCETVAADGKVFFGTKEPGPEGCIYALNATTGEQLWKFGTEGYLQANPTIVEDRLLFGGYFGSNQGKVYCINATTGSSIWNYTTQDRPCCIAVVDEKVYVSCGHWETSTYAAVYCLDIYDSDLIWKFDTTRDIAGSLTVANGKVYFSASNEGYNCIVYALNATNGAIIWSTTSYSYSNSGRTAVAYGKVFISLSYGVYALDETDGSEIWAFPTSVPVGGGPIVADNKVFFGLGGGGHTVYSLNAATGTVVWSYMLEGYVHSQTSAIANGRLFIADHYYSKLYAFESLPVAPLSVSISPLSASILVGQSVTFTSNVSGGYTPYEYQWHLGGFPVSGATSSSWAFTPTTSGIYYVYLEVTDSYTNIIQSETARITVTPPVPVGGYSISMETGTKTYALAPYLALVTISAIVFVAIRRKTERKAKS